MKITKDKITGWNMIGVNHSKNIEQQSYLWCNKIELINNHLMFYAQKRLIFKVWLEESKWQKYKDIKEAMKDVGLVLLDLWLTKIK